MSMYPVSEPSQLDRPIIFIPNWLDQRIGAYGKTEKVLKNIQDLFSILIPADVSFYNSQVEALKTHPALQPYYDTFRALDYTSFDENISNQKASKKSFDTYTKLLRGAESSDPTFYTPNKSFTNDSMGSLEPVASDDSVRINPALMASLLGVSPNDPKFDPLNIRVIINDMDADCLTLRIAPIDVEQSKVPQILEQTNENIKTIAQYYDLKTVMSTNIGRLFCRFVLLAPNN